ncbi:MAG: hypothetical protein N3B16_11930 [Candidatus Aminicenantes bacterium]|nr:hypothetical protein [Candidatus Aminicenantes bacterium]
MKFESHLLSMIVYAFLVSIVLGLLRRNDLKSRLRYMISLFLIMVGGAILFGWFMFLFAR